MNQRLVVLSAWMHVHRLPSMEGELSVSGPCLSQSDWFRGSAVPPMAALLTSHVVDADLYRICSLRADTKSLPLAHLLPPELDSCLLIPLW